MTLAKVVKTIKEYCQTRESCETCIFRRDNPNKWIGCALEEEPSEWHIPTETNIYDQEEIHENCTVQILRNSVTGETSIGWWKEE